ncbi:hypothetical protein DRW03_18955 [Corallococcus sp. H22C18031201]|nr:hypothetical protein DRW03_18955 [Corallococcus sp. H22C18031201]
MSLAASMLLGLLLASPPASPAQALHAQCRARAADPGNPWALAHGMDLDGKAFRARDGRLAADVIVGDFLHRAPGDAASADLFFDARTAAGVPVEPHPALQVKTLLVAGVPLSRRFPMRDGSVTLRALVEDLKRDFRPALAQSPDGAWTLDALSHVLAPGDTFRDGAGDAVHIDAVMDSALATLEAAQADLAAGMKTGAREVPKRGQGIYAHPCGGLHWFQAVASWARFASVRRAWGRRLDTQVEVLLYRLDSEARQYETALSAEPAYRVRLLSQMVKFYGHLLESLGRYRDEAGWRPTAAQTQAVQRALTYLERATSRLEATGAYHDTDSLAASDPQLAWDLVGDACHAARGWDLWQPRAPK